jgi:hypothetical protein
MMTGIISPSSFIRACLDKESSLRIIDQKQPPIQNEATFILVFSTYSFPTYATLQK